MCKMCSCILIRSLQVLKELTRITVPNRLACETQYNKATTDIDVLTLGLCRGGCQHQLAYCRLTWAPNGNTTPLFQRERIRQLGPGRVDHRRTGSALQSRNQIETAVFRSQTNATFRQVPYAHPQLTVRSTDTHFC